MRPAMELKAFGHVRLRQRRTLAAKLHKTLNMNNKLSALTEKAGFPERGASIPFSAFALTAKSKNLKDRNQAAVKLSLARTSADREKGVPDG
jgi:hypothetical protein